MIYPAIASLLEKVDNRFTLSIIIAKRARQLTNGAHILIQCDSRKPVTIATNEVNENRITFVRTKCSIK